MKLLTKEIETQLEKHPFHSQEGKGGEADILVKFFNPIGIGTWYVLEGEKMPNGDWEFFGIVDLHCREYGYFTLKELTDLRLPLGLKIERDMYFGKQKVKDLKEFY